MSRNYVKSTVHDISQNGQKTAISLPKSLDNTDKKLFWERVRGILPHREDLVVAGREVKGGIVIHPIIATAILGVVVTLGLSIRSEMNWQHDQLVTLSVQKVEAENRDAERAETLAKRLQNIDAVQIVLGRDVAKLQEADKLKNSKGQN